MKKTSVKLLGIVALLVCSCLFLFFYGTKRATIKAGENEELFPLEVNSKWNERKNTSSVELEWEDINKGQEYEVVQKEKEQAEVVVKKQKENRIEIENVRDTAAPDAPNISLVKDVDEDWQLEIKAKDNGSIYQWQIRSDGKESKIGEEEIISEIKGYVYELNESPDTVPTIEKNADGNIDNINAEVDLPNQTAIVEKVDVKDQWLHVVSVDRANNVSEATHVDLATLQPQERAANLMTFNVQRTGNQLQITDFTLDSSKDKKMKSIEFQVPEQFEMNDIKTLLPTGWQSFENSDVKEGGKTYASYTVGMYDDVSKNTTSVIKNFIEQVRFKVRSTKTNMENDTGNIKIILHERIYTSYKHEDGKNHYYTFVPKSGVQKTWMQAYNLAKGMRYRGLTGYLATLTSEKEHTFVYENIAKQSGWLGGTRMVVNSDKSKINDSATISETIGTYNLTTTYATQYYWACGPETGTVFFDKPTYASGGKAPAGVYQGFNNPKATPPQTGAEPNNSGTEYVVEFAQGSAGAPTKYWNDLNYDRSQYNTGYYVEFSEYGTQKETEDETDVTYVNAIPQKITLKAYNEKGKALTSGDILLDQNLKINATQSITPKTIELYDFVKILDKYGNTIVASDSTKDLYTLIVTNQYSENKIIYSNRKLTVHARQVVTESSEELTIPNIGYSSIQSSTADGKSRQLYQTLVPSSTIAESDYKTMLITCKDDEPNYSYEAMIPMYHQLIGYVMTTSEKKHDVIESNLNKPTINAETNREIWITTYIKPTTKTPSLNHSNSKNNNLGAMDILN